MTYTTKQLQAMSDFEVNKAIALKLGMTVKTYGMQVCVCGFDGLESTWDERDYCNNPNDIMPLAFERGISIIQWGENGSYTAVSGSAVFFGVSHGANAKDSKYRQYEDMNPLRAIACLLLMMED